MGGYLRKSFRKLNLPLADLNGMNAEFRSDLRARLPALGRFKRCVYLEGRIVCLSHRDHFIPYLLQDVAGLYAPKSLVWFLGATPQGVKKYEQSLERRFCILERRPPVPLVLLEAPNGQVSRVSAESVTPAISRGGVCLLPRAPDQGAGHFIK